MLNTTLKSAAIAFKIWFFALLFNTVIGSFALGGFTDAFNGFFIYGAYLATIYSFPIFIVIWIFLKSLLSNGATCSKIVGRLLFMGIVLSIITFIYFANTFNDMPGSSWWLGLLAVVSGIVGIVSQANSIKKTCKKRDGEL